MRKCNCCGAEIENDNDIVCQYCGNLLEKAAPPQPQTIYTNSAYGQNPYGSQYHQFNPYATNNYQGYNNDYTAVTKANNARILGILSIFINPLFIFSIIAIVFANGAITLSPNNPEVIAAAKIGRVCGIVSIVLGIIGSVLSVAFMAMAMPAL